jgi:putative acyl-CoA dehydrogenase
MQHKRDEFDNQVPELKDYNLYLIDPALQRLVKTLAPSADAELTAQGQTLGSEHTLRLAEDANRYVPELHTHSRIGERIDFVKFHPAWDE